MSDSPEIFDEHTAKLHIHLLSLLGNTAVEAPQGYMLGAGLLNERLDEHRVSYRPRLIVVSGTASWIGPLIGEAVRDDVVIIGATREDDLTADMRIFVACPGTAKEIHKNKKTRVRDLEEWEIGKLSSRVRTSEREQLTINQAGLFYGRVTQELGYTQLETQI